MDNKTSSADSLLYITDRPALVFVEGQGSWLVDHTGKRYLDVMQGWAVNCLGHCHPSMIRALDEQARRLINPSPSFFNAPMLHLAGLLTSHSCFDRVFFANSGAEANEGAVKLARRWGSKHKGGAYEIITFNGSFHGRTLTMMSASGKPGWDALFAPQVPGFPKAIFNDIHSVEQLIGRNTVAVMIEPVQGEGGVNVATLEFMRELRALTAAHELLLVVDEVQSGCGRTGSMFAYEQAQIEPDLMTLGKGIGGGVPLAALLCRSKFDCFNRGDQGGTYNGNPLITAVGCAVVGELLAPGFLDHVTVRSEQLKVGLLKLAAEFDFPGERGSGLLRALVMDRDLGAKIVVQARELQPEGLLINSPQPHLLRFMPALNISAAEINTTLDLLREAISKVLSH